MIPPADDTELKPEKLEEEKEGGALLHCDLYDTDLVHKIAQELLPGLASACVDNTTGGLFRNPASVAVDIRREMVDYLIQRSENFVAESVVPNGGPNEEVSEDPFDIISNFIDNFTSSKRNFLSKVSGWLLSEKREDRIDDFVQEMEINGFWLLNRRESVAQTLLKNVDFKNIYHCSMGYKSPEDLEQHKLTCGFRPMTCMNEGCDSRFSAAQSDQHDLICPFKILKCEQNCSDSIMRREMDRHCITICPTKLVKCPFYSVGCHPSIPQCTINQHRSENLSPHLLYVLKLVHKGASAEDLKERIEQLVKLSSPEQLAAARDARSLTFAIKDLEAKLGPLKVKTTANRSDEVRDLTGSPTKEVNSEGSPREKRESSKSHSPSSDAMDPCQEKDKLVESATNVSKQLESEPNDQNFVSSVYVQESLKESALESKETVAQPINYENLMLPIKAEEHAYSVPESDNHMTQLLINKSQPNEGKDTSNYAQIAQRSGES